MIIINKPDEKIPFKSGESTVYYRHVNLRDQIKINDECYKNGEIDPLKSTLMILEMCIVGWDGIQDANGTPIEFEPGLGVYLPMEISNQLVPLIFSRLNVLSEQAEAEAKNS